MSRQHNLVNSFLRHHFDQTNRRHQNLQPNQQNPEEQSRLMPRHRQ
jgi:hypothetical protein